MANTVQAIKRIRQTKKRNALRSAQRAQTRTAVKNVRKAVSGNMDSDTQAKTLLTANKTLDRMADKGVIHKNKAARLKSRLNRAVKLAAQSSV